MPVRVSEITDEGQNANIQRNSKEALSVLWMPSRASTLVKTVTANLVGTTKRPEVQHGDISDPAKKWIPRMNSTDKDAADTSE